MENENIDITTDVNKIGNEIDETSQKQVDELNDQLNDADGKWIYVDEKIGIVWKPTLPETGEGVVPEHPTPDSTIEGLVRWGNTYDFENIKENSVVIIKLNIDNPMRVHMMQKVIAEQVLKPRIEKLKEKRVCILFMQEGDDISVMTEEEMESAGWEKREKSRIITL